MSIVGNELTDRTALHSNVESKVMSMWQSRWAQSVHGSFLWGDTQCYSGDDHFWKYPKT